MTSPSLNYAILSLDSYNRGYVPGVPGIDGTVVSDYSFRLDSAILVDSNGTRQDIAANFYAAAYQDSSGGIVISYRGTDDPVSDSVGWLGGAGFQTAQAELAAEFYYQVKQAYPGATITLTGHSLGGGLAGLIAKLTGSTACVIDNMPFELMGRAFAARTARAIMAGPLG